MTEKLRLLAVLAHPDDESMGAGASLAYYAAQGVETYLVTATRGERGWFGIPEVNPGLNGMARTREAELAAAARVLGIREITYLDYIDGDLDQAAPEEAIRRIVTQIRRIQPQVVFTFPPDGAYGHPDHIAISQFTNAALVCAADASYRDPKLHSPHRVSKFYYQVDSVDLVDLIKVLMGGISMEVDGVERPHIGWHTWAITSHLPVKDYWTTAWEAVRCHRSQLPSLGSINDLPAETQKQIWGAGNFYRVYSMVNGGRKVETDLFEGLR